MNTTLLDPTNDYVFKRLFGETPELLVALINDLRPDLPAITAVDITNPNIEPSELSGKYIILDVLARDNSGHCYNVEIQVRRYDAWHKRGLFYLASLLSKQLSAGEDYQALNSAVGIHLLDFDLFNATAGERQQAIWRFEMRDGTQPHISLGNLLQMNLIELKKADRIGISDRPLRAWVNFLEHWKEGLTMMDTSYEPVKKAMERLKELSADEETRRLAFVRERALRDEISFINDAERRGRKEGREEGLEEGREEAKQRALEEKYHAVRKLIALTEMSDQLIAEIEQLPVEDVARLRAERQH